MPTGTPPCANHRCSIASNIPPRTSSARRWSKKMPPMASCTVSYLAWREQADGYSLSASTASATPFTVCIRSPVSRPPPSLDRTDFGITAFSKCDRSRCGCLVGTGSDSRQSDLGNQQGKSMSLRNTTSMGRGRQVLPLDRGAGDYRQRLLGTADDRYVAIDEQDQHLRVA
jgi:hypothetical protein